MKRELNSRSRRKWVVGGALVFGSVALLTTGFATWVVGVSVKEADGTIAVDAETARNDSFLFSVKEETDKTAKLGDPADYTPVSADPFVSPDDEDTTDVGDYTLTYVLKVEKGAEGAPGAVTAELSNNTISNSDTGLIDMPASLRGDAVENKWTVLEISGDPIYSGWTLTSASDVKPYVYEETVTITLKNGSLFKGSAKLCDFYNTYYTSTDNDPNGDAWTAANIEAAVNGINGELAAATTACAGMKVTFTVA